MNNKTTKQSDIDTKRTTTQDSHTSIRVDHYGKNSKTHGRGKDGRWYVSTSPRCKALFSSKHNRTCNKPSLRLNPKEKPPIYTDHCSMHGGRQEKESYLRKIAKKTLETTTKSVESDLLQSLDVDPSQTRNTIPNQTIGETSTGSYTRSETNPEDGKDVVSIGNGFENLKRENQAVPQKSEAHYPPPSLPSLPGGPIPEPHYKIRDSALKTSFDNQFSRKDQVTLNSELALVRAMIQNLVGSAKSVNPESMGTLDKLLSRADRLLNTILKIEETRKVQYTRESLRMDVMKVVQVIRKIVPEDDRRRLLATELARVLGPSLVESGDVIISRETFKRG